MTLERVNQLFRDGVISAEEHGFLVAILAPSPKRTSGFAWACLVCAAVGWILMMTFTVNGQQWSLLPSGEARLAVGGILSTLSLIMFLVARRETKTRADVGGQSIAAAGLAIAVAILSIVIPVVLLIVGRS